MAYDFNGTNQYITATLGAFSSPFTLACWFNADSANAPNTYVLFGIQNLSNGHRSNIFASGNIAGDPVQAATTIGASFVSANSTTGFSVNTWHHVCGVFTSNTSRTVYLDGGSSTTNTASMSPDYGTATIASAARHNGTSWGLLLDGRTAECGIWDVALTTNEIASLARGMTCDKVRPQNLRFYAPLIRDLQDVRGGLNITNNNGATVANHPRIYA